MTLVRDENHLCEVLGIPFTAAQLAAITAPTDAPGVVVAGAGSGKTAVMAARVVWLVGHQGVAPERILGLTFTNKAAAELGQRIRASLARMGATLEAEPTALTYHAFAGRLIAEHGLRLGIEPDLRVVTDASRFQRFARAVERYDGPIELVTTHIPWIVREAPRLDAELAEHLVTPEQLREFDAALIALDHPAAPEVLRTAAATARKRTELIGLVEAYRAAKRDDGVMDFSDQMAWGAQLAALPEVRRALREQYEVVLLDEYQDTSVAQRDMLVALFAGLAVTAVGDPAQGIYGWRGAAVGNLEEFLADFCLDRAPGRSFSLAETRRCRPEIIAAANHVVADLYAAKRDVVAPLTSAKDPGGVVDVALYSTVSEEIAAMVASIRAIGEEGEVPLRDVAILVRVAKENGEIVKALRDAHLPFEIVGLQGLLAQPEIVDVVSLLQVVDDATANPAVLRLLAGDRWRIGPRDLALLGRRASLLSRSHRGEQATESPLAAALTKAVEGTDPTEVVSLADALDDPGDLPYSDEARVRFAEFAGIVRRLRQHAAEPLVDLARRAVRALEIDIELEAGDVEGGGDNLALFLDAVADYAQGDRFASLRGLLGYLAAEQDFNFGMEVSTPSEADSVKLMTIHKAKGLEWHTVFVPLMSATVFPTGQRRPDWLTGMLAVPTPLRGDRRSLPAMPEDPQCWTGEDAQEVKSVSHGLALAEERRLAYVAYTRAAERLHLSGHHWGRTQRKPLGPSMFLIETREWLQSVGALHGPWADPPVDGAVNPHLEQVRSEAWPPPTPQLSRRLALAEAVHRRLDGDTSVPPAPADPRVAARLDAIEADIDLLLAEAAAADAEQRAVALPATMSATSVLALTKDAASFARAIARPMPRRPSAAARFGTRFHAWVEARFGMQGVLLDPDDLPGRADTDIESDTELREVIALFESGPFADRTPVAIEAPFSLVLAGHQVIGQIDAVFETTAGSYEVVDWKTNRTSDADPLQLAIYRLAWAELRGVEPARVGAAFYYVRRGEVVRFDDLPGRAELEEQVSGGGTVLG